MRAQARYLKAGVYPRFPIYHLYREPKKVVVDRGLTIEAIDDLSAMMPILAEVDTAALGFRRDSDHEYYLSERQGFLYRRDGNVLGYGYVGQNSGPFALLDATDFPAVLAHAETVASKMELPHFGLYVPMCNVTAAAYLLQRGYQIFDFLILFMCNQPFGQLANYIITSPPFFL